MKYCKTTILYLSVLLCGCSSQRVINQSNTPVAEETPVTRPIPILHGEGIADQHQIKTPTVREVTPPRIIAKNKPITSEIPKITFTEVESANVRVPGNNPLPSSGELTLDLNELSNNFCYPYQGKVISNYGKRGRSMHTGVDIKAIPNDTIRAAMSGVVRMSKYYSGYGNIVVIRHGCGVETVYSHQSKNLVKPNDIVKAGEAIGLAGRTGRATTEHVHFELRVACEHIDPSKFLDYEKRSLREGFLTIKNRSGKLLATNTLTEGIAIPMTALEPASQVSENPTSSSLSTANATTTVKSVPTTSAKSATSQQSATYHTVKKGDTLSAIARNYSTTVATICKINNISKDGVLRLGQRIKLK